MSTYIKPLVLALLCATSMVIAGENPPSLVDQGNLELSKHHVEKAEALFKQAIASDPKSARAYARLGALYLTTNRSRAAIEPLQQAIMLDPDNPKLFMLMSIAYIHQAHYSMADAMAKEAQRLDPDMKNARKMREYIKAKQAALATDAPPAPAKKR